MARMRSQVRNSGKLKCTGLVQLLVDALGQCTADALDAGEIVDARGEHALQAAEVLEKFPAPRRPHGVDLLEARGGARLAAPGTVARDRETVGFVAHLLDQVQRRMVVR